MKKLVAKTVAVLRNPVMRPVEIWAVRALLAFVTVKYGLNASGR